LGALTVSSPISDAKSRPGRVLHVTTRYVRGGAERNMERVMLAEVDAGWDVHFAVGAESNLDVMPPGVTVHRLERLGRAIRPRDDLHTLLQIRRLIRKERFDVVHTHESKAGAVGRAAAYATSAVVVHTVHMPSFGPGYGRVGSWVYRSAERICARTTDVYVVVGDELRTLYLAGGVGHPQQFLTLRSPVEIERFSAVRFRTGESVLRHRHEFGLDPALPVVVSVGRFDVRKRHSLLIERLSPALERGAFQLALAGEGPEEAALRELVKTRRLEAGVHFLGHVVRVECLLGGADVLVHASRCEGVPQVVLQALAAGVPVVATDVEGLREVPDAPIVIVDRSGDELLAATLRCLADPPTAIPLERLAPWTECEINRALRDLAHRIQAAAGRGA